MSESVWIPECVAQNATWWKASQESISSIKNETQIINNIIHVINNCFSEFESLSFSWSNMKLRTLLDFELFQFPVAATIIYFIYFAHYFITMQISLLSQVYLFVMIFYGENLKHFDPHSPKITTKQSEGIRNNPGQLH